MNTLVYKRTHTGDPGPSRIFGVNDCMGRVRGFNFDSVIGIGGVGPWHDCKGIALKINWIGVGSHPTDSKDGKRGPMITFDRFALWDEHGPDLEAQAPNLFNHMSVVKSVRFVMSKNLPTQLQKEINGILKLLDNTSTKNIVKSKREISTESRC